MPPDPPRQQQRQQQGAVDLFDQVPRTLPLQGNSSPTDPQRSDAHRNARDREGATKPRHNSSLRKEKIFGKSGRRQSMARLREQRNSAVQQQEQQQADPSCALSEQVMRQSFKHGAVALVNGTLGAAAKASAGRIVTGSGQNAVARYDTRVDDGDSEGGLPRGQRKGDYYDRSDKLSDCHDSGDDMSEKVMYPTGAGEEACDANQQQQGHDSAGGATVPPTLSDSPAQNAPPLEQALDGAAPSGKGASTEVSVSSSEALVKTEMDQIRGYLDLLDEFSLHHFIIWKGKIVHETPEFASFQRTYADCWGSISRCTSMLESLMKRNKVPMAIIDGRKLAQAISFDMERLDVKTVLSTVANIDQVEPLLKHLRMPQPGLKRKAAAAILIQACMRRYISLRRFQAHVRQRIAATYIQALSRGHLGRVRATWLLQLDKETAAQEWSSLQDSLRSNWTDLSQHKEKVIVHLPSLAMDEAFRLGERNFDSVQNLQLSRLSTLAQDENTHVVYVSPSPLPQAVLQYHQKILELAGVEGVAHRLHVVVPEHHSLFPAHLPLASLLLYSPRAMARIATLVKGRPAFIVPGLVGWQERRLALALRLPLLSADPAVCEALSTVSATKKVFAGADVNVPIGCHDIYDEKGFLVALTKLVAGHVDVQRWIFRIDIAFEHRGVAYLDVNELPCIQQLRKEKAALLNGQARDGAVETWNSSEVQLQVRARVLKELSARLSTSAVVCCPEVYSSWREYHCHMMRMGGVIEAQAPNLLGRPMASLLIDPQGGVEVLSEAELLVDEHHARVGSMYPQQAVPSGALRSAAVAMGKALSAKGVMGYVSVYFDAFWDAKRSTERLWGTGVELFLSRPACSHMFFLALSRSETSAAGEGGAGPLGDRRGGPAIASALSVLTGASVGGQQGVAGVEAETATRAGGQAGPNHYVHVDYIHHPGLCTVRHASFFKLCRMEGVSFDLHSRTGTIFTLVNSLAGGVIGLMATDSSRIHAVQRVMKGVTFLRKIAGVPVEEASRSSSSSSSSSRRRRAPESTATSAAAKIGSHHNAHRQRMRGGGGGGGGPSPLGGRAPGSGARQPHGREKPKFSGVRPSLAALQRALASVESQSKQRVKRNLGTGQRRSNAHGAEAG